MAVFILTVLGGLLNATLGNVVELIVAILALVRHPVQLLQVYADHYSSNVNSRLCSHRLLVPYTRICSSF